MSAEGGMEVEENWDKVVEVKFSITDSEEEIEKKIRGQYSKRCKKRG